nr:cyclophilin-like family protein [uncultured Desulfobacter sp.]
MKTNQIIPDFGSVSLREAKPVPAIPPGGIAYTNNGDYVCIFFGPTPAWPVEYIGQIDGGTWKNWLKIQLIQLLY